MPKRYIRTKQRREENQTQGDRYKHIANHSLHFWTASFGEFLSPGSATPVHFICKATLDIVCPDFSSFLPRNAGLNACLQYEGWPFRTYRKASQVSVPRLNQPLFNPRCFIKQKQKRNNERAQPSRPALLPSHRPILLEQNRQFSLKDSVWQRLPGAVFLCVAGFGSIAQWSATNIKYTTRCHMHNVRLDD